ncbi:hypothetical protein SH661x_000933 [Planctomicrobium sp. SH661]|uniref:hypothetical protein n=1 Tax=Planctomicrobium sp. SH661 TaxID=3448124 RepID=UPI003F5B7E0A
MEKSFHCTYLAAGLLVLGAASACTSLSKTAYQTHGGIKYTLHEDTRFSRVEKGKNGSLMYDSPELTMSCENGRLVVNGVHVGNVNPGDHVEVTDTQMVLVNGQPRGDMTTGSELNRQRIKQSKLEAAAR